MAKLILYLKDQYYTEQEIDIPKIDRTEPFCKQVEMRELYVTAQVELFRQANSRRIAKCDNNYKIFLQVESMPEEKTEEAQPAEDHHKQFKEIFPGLMVNNFFPRPVFKTVTNVHRTN